MSIFKELLSIKTFREGQAELGLKKTQAELGLARKENDKLQSALELYREEARVQEMKWYSDLCAKLVKLREITEVREDVGQLREGERQRRASADQAAKVLENATER